MKRHFTLLSLGVVIFFICCIARAEDQQQIIEPAEQNVAIVADDQKTSMEPIIENSKVDLTILIHVKEESIIFLRNCLRSIFEVLKEVPSLTYEVFILEVETLAGAKNFERKVAITQTIEDYSDVFLIESDDKKGWPTVLQAYNNVVLPADKVTATGKVLLFLDDHMELLPGFLGAGSQPLVSIVPEIGIIGAKLIRGDGTVHHAGIDFVMTKLPKPVSKTRTTYSSAGRRGRATSVESQPQPDKKEEEDKNVPIPFYAYQGYSAQDPRVSVDSDLSAVSVDGMLVSRSLFKELKGFNESLPESYAVVDFCLRAKHNLNRKVVYFPARMANIYADNVPFLKGEDLRTFNDRWGAVVQKQIEDNYLIKNITLVWNMECGKGQVLGFTTEALGFVLELYKLMPLKVEVTNINTCKDDLESIGLPAAKITLLERLNDMKLQNEVVYVVHRDPGRYSYFIDSFTAKEPLYIIGRSMYETDRIPQKWVTKCNTLVDTIWTPSHFNVETFAASGVARSKLDVMPETVDTAIYNPATTKPMKLSNKKDFNFLSVMKWEKRKGWDILLTAYLTEFSSSDSVSLYIRSNMDDRNTAAYKDFVAQFIEDSGRTSADLPQIVFIKDQLPYSQFPSLYKAMDAVVLATHGEGWGLPLIEGMSMELPVIATNWSGNTEFMTDSNSYPVPVEEMVEAGVEDGHLWAKCSLDGLKIAMRNVFENRAEAKKVGLKARQDILEKYTQEKVANLVIQKLSDLERRIPELQRQKQLNKENKEKEKTKKPDEDTSKKDHKIQIKIVDDVK